MGVKTKISLTQLNRLFPKYNFTNLTPTLSGIIDTTYIVFSKTHSYILKKYEREMGDKIDKDRELLEELKAIDLNVPRYIDSKSGWYLYEKLKGSQPKNIRTYHIQELARFLSKLHRYTYKKKSHSSFVDKDEVGEFLNYVKLNFYAFYKKVDCLKGYKSLNDGLIHGDIFKDNTVFYKNKIGVFDFIDSGCGSFTFDAGVALVGFDILKHKKYFINIFLNSYNQNAPKKISKKEIELSIKIASKFYALKRVYIFKSTKDAKELISYI